MRCRYTFPVKGILRLDKPIPFRFRHFTFSFAVAPNRVVQSISVEFEVAERAQWPTVIRPSSSRIQAHFHITSPEFDTVTDIVRYLESVMVLYGINTVAIDEVSTEWIPENADERKELGVLSFSGQKKPIDPSRLEPIGIGLLAQTVFSYNDGRHLEVGFSFARHGILAFAADHFIQAVYNFYFFLETRFGDGKFKSKQVESAFKGSEHLCSAVRKERDEFDVSSHPKRSVIESRFNKYYRGRTAAEILCHIVSLRGFLHHHNSRRPENWHPARHWDFSGDAFFLYGLIGRLMLTEVTGVICAPEVTSEVSTEIAAQLAKRQGGK